MLTDKQIDEIDYMAAQEQMWSDRHYAEPRIKPDTVRALTTELKRHRRMIAAVRDAWLDEGDYPMQHREASEWVRTNWPTLTTALERLAQNSEWE